MTAGDPGTAGGSLTRDQVLDELEFLVTVEHALVVEYLSVRCALGHDLDAGEGGATTKQARAAADAASLLAQGEMFHLRGINLALVEAGRSAQLGRADSISSDSSPATALGPPSLAQLQGLLAREQAIAAAVDERYTKLSPAVTSAPVFDGALLTQLRSGIVDHGPTHVAALASLGESLGTLPPAGYLRATRRDAADDFEQRLLEISDGNYALTLAALGEQFGRQAGFSPLAVSAMTVLDNVSRVLVQRGLLPPFTLS